jgi:type IV pilus assembly protein PilO
MALSKQQQQQVVLAVLLGAGVLYAFWSYGWKPTNEKITRLTVELNETLDKVETMKRIAQRLPALQREYDELLVMVSQTEKRLPREKNLQDILRIVTDLSQKHQVSVMSFTPQSPVEKTIHSEVPVTLSISGAFHNVGKFMSALGQEERILSASQLNISYLSGSKKGQTVTGSFILTAYVFKG